MELTKHTLDWNRPVIDTFHTYEETADAIVPDTFPDILRISAAYGTAQLNDDSPQSGRVLISGSVQVTVLYVPEHGGLRRLTVPISFAHIEESDGITEDSRVFVNCQVVSTSTGIMNSRKLSVSALLSVRCSVYSQETLSLTDGIEESDGKIEILSTAHTITVPTAIQRKEFTIMDDLSVPDSSRLEDIFAPCGDIHLTECRILNGKAVLKGECMVHMLGMTAEQQLDQLNCSLPFTQIFDVPAFDDHNQLDVRFSLRHLDVQKHEGDELSIGLVINVLLTAFATHTITSISDIYHLQYSIKAETKSLVIPVCRPISDVLCDSSDTVPVGMKAVSIADVRAALDTILRDDGRTSLRMMATILYCSDDGEYYSISRAIHIPLQLSESVQNIQLSSLVCRTTATISGDNSVVLSLSGRCSLLCTETLHLSDICSLEINRSQAAEHPPVSIILRYVEQEERLWDIAKHYRTTVDAIRHANQLSEDCPATAFRMLLIPIR